jgi:hypothetical protein
MIKPQGFRFRLIGHVRLLMRCQDSLQDPPPDLPRGGGPQDVGDVVRNVVMVRTSRI